jgi:hypothetical protein
MYLQSAYLLGASTLRAKLGAVAGPIAYAPRNAPDNHTLSDTNMQMAWVEADRRPAPSVDTADAKLAGLDAGGYASFSNGLYGVGSADANQGLVDKDLRQTDTINRAFATNAAVDQSFGPEPAITQPHGSRYASFREHLQKTAAGMGLGGGVGLGGGSGLGGIRNAGLGGAKSMMGPGMGATTLNAPKPMQARDPRADKPPGMNLQHAVQTTSGISDMGTSIGSRMRRMDGNPM